MAQSIPGPLRELLDIPNDANAFALAIVRKVHRFLGQVLNRVAARTGKASYTVVDNDKKKKGNQRATISLKRKSGDTVQHTLCKIMIVVQRGDGLRFLDECWRYWRGEAVGKGLDDEPTEEQIRHQMQLIAQGSIPFQGSRSFEPITMTLLIGVGVPLLIAFGPQLLNWAIEAAKSAFKVEDANGNPTGGTAEQDDASAGIPASINDAFEDVLSGDGDPTNDTKSFLIVGALAVAVFFLLKKVN